jgi:hypothetical protein
MLRITRGGVAAFRAPAAPIAHGYLRLFPTENAPASFSPIAK